MPNRLPIPDELAHLIEKRSGEERRQESTDAPPTADAEPSDLGAEGSLANGEKDDRREKEDRRKS
ncbi:MAG: hypothetical protein KDA61_16290 [Planctomycetales bacterium]|nr:hypothetical protein [Planctomycetales bacterium]